MNKTILSIFFILAIFIISCNNKDDTKIVYIPIGYIVSENTPELGAPRQGMLMPEKKAYIEIDEKYIGALRDLTEFEYIVPERKLPKFEILIKTRQNLLSYFAFSMY